MPIFTRLLVITLSLFVVSQFAACDDASLPVDPAKAAIEVSRTRCGIHSLYCMLRLNGLDVPHDQIVTRVPVGPKGSSLAELQRAAAVFDCPCQVYRCEFNDLEKWDYFALIALLGPDGNIVTDFRRSRESTEQNVGHFVTLVNYDPSSNMISAIDGSYGEVRQFSKRRFLEMWTGYVLAPDRSQNSGFPLGWVAGNGAFGLAALAWFTIWSARRRAKVRVRSADVVVDPSGGR